MNTVVPELRRVGRQESLLPYARAEFLDLIHFLSSIVGILATYIGGQSPLPPKCLGGKRSHNGHFEQEHKDVPTLTKAVFACKRIRR